MKILILFISHNKAPLPDWFPLPGTKKLHHSRMSTFGRWVLNNI